MRARRFRSPPAATPPAGNAIPIRRSRLDGSGAEPVPVALVNLTFSPCAPPPFEVTKEIVFVPYWNAAFVEFIVCVGDTELKVPPEIPVGELSNRTEERLSCSDSHWSG